MKGLFVILAVVLLAASGATAQRAIDDFQAGDYGLGREGIAPPNVVSGTQYDPSGLHILGGQRDVTLNKLTGSTLQPYVNCVSNYEYLGDLGFSSYNSAFGCNAIWTMVYGLAGPLNANLAGSATAILVDLIDGDMYSGPRPIPLEITVVSGAGTASVTRQLIDPGTYEYPFSEFAGVDFSDVDRVEVEVVQDSAINDAVDFALGGIYVNCLGPSGTDQQTWSAVKGLYR